VIEDVVHRPVALIVDDEPDIRSVISFILDRAGFEVREESDGEAGLATAKEIRPVVVLLDWMMPRMNGIEVCRALRQNADQDSAIVIFLTAKAQESDIDLGLAAGAQDYIMKPFRPALLVSRVQALVAQAEYCSEALPLRHETTETIPA
jgi:two-component system phosphate regulon response regulator PhoB